MTVESSAQIEETLQKKTATSPSTREEQCKKEEEKKKEKMVITGDDILIEYVSRICRTLQSLLALYQKKLDADIA